MCELFALSAQTPAEVTFSLGVLARRGGLTGPHKDGWGAAYYEGRDIRLIKEAHSAADSDWVRFIENHPLRSTIVLSHIRQASVGRRILSNTHPFARELGARMHVLAHNGTLRDIETAAPFAGRRYRPVGDTDSETAFCALMERMVPVWGDGTAMPPVNRRLEIFAAFAADARRLGSANFIYADGDALFIHAHRRIPAGGGPARPPGLHILSRACALSGPTVEGAAISAGKPGQKVTLVASVPLTDEPWEALAEGTCLALKNGRLVARAASGEGL